ncbi:radical SAM protein [Candidatus Pacearchaeota archaeon]|nr:radical SAM protein [Candidatus Pacearchaeota archaeon]
MQLKELQVSITNVCSIGCSYCYKSKLAPTFLSEKSLDNIIAIAKENDIDTLRLTGGDIFEHPDILEFLRKIKIANLKVIANISIQRIKRFDEISQFIDYCLLSFQNADQILEYKESLTRRINENPKIKFMVCMVFQKNLPLEKIFEDIREIPLEDFFFLRDINSEEKDYLLDLLKLSEKIVIWNSKENKIRNPIKIANAFPLCLVSRKALEYCDGGQNDDGNNFIYINENGDIKLNSYSSVVLGNILGTSPLEFKEIISKAKENASEPLSDDICQSCKIKERCLGGIKVKDEITKDPLTKFRGESLKDKYFSNLQKNLTYMLPETKNQADYIPIYFRHSDFFMQYPTLDQWKTPSSFEELIEKIKNSPVEKEFGLYLHFPFCNSRCKFCGIQKYPNQHIKSYIDFMLKEIEKFKEVLITNNIRYIYIGGGTPTTIGKENFQKIFDKLFSYLPKENIKEITMETFPSNFDKKFFDYLQNYITRLSIGVQCFNDKILQEFGRPSTIEEMTSFFNSLKNYTFTKSIDIIYGVYLDDMDSYESEMETMLSLNPDNVTYQPLHNSKRILESDELFFIEYSKKLDWLNKKGRLILDSNGYRQYTAEDFHKIGKPKFEYQINFLNQGNILGIGINTFSFVGKTYFANMTKDNYKKFELQGEQDELHKISLKSRLLNFEIEEKYKLRFSDSLNYLQNKNIIIIENNKIEITKEGLNYVDLISQILMINNFNYKQK